MQPRVIQYINTGATGAGEASGGVHGDDKVTGAGGGGRRGTDKRCVIHLDDRKPGKSPRRAPDEHFKLANCSTSGGG